MKKTQKQFFGCLGLGVVATMTAVAIALPAPQASAITTAVKDFITVRVVSDVPVIGNITVTKTNDGSEVQQQETITDPHLTVTTPYDGVETVHYSLEYTYTNADGTDVRVYDPIIDDIDAGYAPGTATNPLNLDDPKFDINGTHGYGHYVLTVTGEGYGGVTDEKSFEFFYAPFLNSAEQNDETGEVEVDITDINTEDVSTIDVYVNGELIGTITVDGNENIVYPFVPKDAGKEQDLVITLLARDSEGNPIFLSDEMTVHYTPLPVPDTGTPDTGGLFRDLNISSEDYLVTGLIAFFVVGIVGFGVVARGRKENRNNKRR